MITYYNRFWIPLYKKQLLKWFKDYRSEWKQSDLKKKSKKELMAIYIKERRK